MKILVTGGAGFIASHIVDAYINLGHNVVVIDNLSSGKKEFVNKKAKFYQLDIRRKNEIKQLIKEEKPEIINHHAAQINVRASVEDPLFDAEVNILGFLNILEAARTEKVRKIIFASSGGAIYGEASILPTPEGYQPIKPLSPYGVSKLVSEYYLNYYYQIHKLPFIALRYSNVYGPRQNPYGEAGVVAIFSERLLSRQASIINGEGKQTRDYIYVEDVVEANIAALSVSKIDSFNIATGKETSVLEIYRLLSKITQTKVDAIHGPAKAGEQARSCLDSQLAFQQLGWRAKVSLKEGLKRTADYFKHADK